MKASSTTHHEQTLHALAAAMKAAVDHGYIDPDGKLTELADDLDELAMFSEAAPNAPASEAGLLSVFADLLRN